MGPAKKADNAPRNTALITTQGSLAYFVYHQVTGGHEPCELVQPQPIPKLQSALQGKAYRSYIVDIAALPGEPYEVVQMLTVLRDAAEGPVILVASGDATDHPLVEELMANGFEQWVVSDALTTMYTEMESCLAGARNAIELAEQERLARQQIEQNV
ncbi:MAG: hypothetical protein ACK5L3_05735, partial [Oscillospiraceae bacterium]